MNPFAVAPFGQDPWWLVLVKVVLLFVILLAWTIVNVWFERRVLAKMQNRIGPVMNSAWAGGVFQAVGDGLKLVFKEIVKPRGRTASSSAWRRSLPASRHSARGR